MKHPKFANSTRPKGRALDKALAARLREILGSVPWLRDWKVEVNPAPHDRAFDLFAEIPLRAKNHVELWVQSKDLPRPSQFPYVALRNDFGSDGKRTTRVPVLAAPFVSERMAELCQKHGWGWFDLAGNCRLSVPGGFHIDRTGNDPEHRPPEPQANLGTKESARVVRAVLVPQNAGKRWTQRELADEAARDGRLELKVSIGLVNKLVSHFRSQSFIMDHEKGGFRLHDPLGLLAAWRSAYRFDRHQRLGYFTLKKGRDLQDALASLVSITGGHAAYAAFSAAEFQWPHVRQPKTWLFIDADWEDEFRRVVEAKPVDSGENLMVLIPDDAGVFYWQEGEAGRLACTNPVQTYVDLCHCGSRGEEAAEALLEHDLKPSWKARGIKLG